MKTLADRLSMAMKSANISQAELARLCGVKPPSVNGWLSGKSKFLRGENLLKAAEALQVSEDWLATGQGEATPSNRKASIRPEPELLTATQLFLDNTFKVLGKTFSMVSDADLFADAYEWLAECGNTQNRASLENFSEWRKGRKNPNN